MENQSTVPAVGSLSNYASFWQRLVAVLIDGLILGIVNFLLGLVLAQLGDSIASSAWLISMAINWGYVIYFIGKDGATPGKKLMKIKVIRVGGGVPSYGQAFLREILGKFVSALILGIGYLWMIWDPNKQTLHDKIAKTHVVKA